MIEAGSQLFLISGDWSVPVTFFLLLDATSCSFYLSLMLILCHFCQKGRVFGPERKRVGF